MELKRPQTHLFALTFLLACPVWADSPIQYDHCFNQAAQRYQVPKEVLLAIAEQESAFNPRAVNGSNKNGSTDYGIMQINSWWIPRLKQFGVQSPDDLFDPCLNIQIGAWIFSQNISRYGWNWRGVGAYNAATDSKRLRYAEKILARWKRIEREINS